MAQLDEIGDPGYSWWDLYNTSDFLHSLGHDVFILSMPLKGVNLGPGCNDTYLLWGNDPAHRSFILPLFPDRFLRHVLFGAGIWRLTTSGCVSGRSRATPRCGISSSPPT